MHNYKRKDTDECNETADTEDKDRVKNSKDFFKCYQCDATFTRMEYKRDHETKFAKNRQPSFRCQFCPKIFCTKQSRAKHFRGNHSELAKIVHRGSKQGPDHTISEHTAVK